jgi:hypothetical protein
VADSQVSRHLLSEDHAHRVGIAVGPPRRRSEGDPAIQDQLVVVVPLPVGNGLALRSPRFGDMQFVDESGELAKQSSWLAVHLHDTSRLPRLTAAEIVSMGGTDITSLTVFACAAATTVHSSTTELVRLDVPHERIPLRGLLLPLNQVDGPGGQSSRDRSPHAQGTRRSRVR